mmetsp:Transcript_4981/g.4573  ORF Transcript_4981/g.4573 Transcript_4981/m.4573 type:complete len:96 (+) Transcript_4981:239-526(+)
MGDLNEELVALIDRTDKGMPNKYYGNFVDFRTIKHPFHKKDCTYEIQRIDGKDSAVLIRTWHDIFAFNCESEQVTHLLLLTSFNLKNLGNKLVSV